MMIQEAHDAGQWDAFLNAQVFSPFLQSWTMGEVYRETNQIPIRLEAREGKEIVGICQGIIVPARRGKHIAIPYGPVVSAPDAKKPLLDELSKHAQSEGCSFLRVSPFWKKDAGTLPSSLPSPLHLLAEHIWYLPLTEKDTWTGQTGHSWTEEGILKNMRKNTRNLIRRAEKEGVVIERSTDPLKDLPHFIALHDETQKRHGFTPYTNTFFEAQVRLFSQRNECTLYLARYNKEVIASSIHMHTGGETSYHHGASTHKYNKIPASYLLQWTAIQDAIARGDSIYSFWGIAPEGVRKHPFAGVTLFKRGFGGSLLELTHCQDLPLHAKYRVTRAFEYLRKWKRGF